jgi:hypothetical protein
MLYLICRNRVSDYIKWREVFDSHAIAHRQASLFLRHISRALADPKNVFYVFEVKNLRKARAFMGAPGAVEARRASGVLEGEYHFVERARGY